MSTLIRTAVVSGAMAVIAAAGLTGALAQSDHSGHGGHEMQKPAASMDHGGHGAATGGDAHAGHSMAAPRSQDEHEAHGHNGGHGDDMLMMHGSATVAKLLVFPHRPHLEEAVGRSIHIVANGSAIGLIDIVNGDADVAMVAASVDDIRRSLDRHSPGALNGAEFQEHHVGTIRTSFIVHRDNPVGSLSKDQLRDVLTGKITNWKALGGADRPVVLFITKPGDGARSLIDAQLLDGQSMTPAARQIAALPQIARIVAQMPNAIGLADDSTISPLVTVLSGTQIEQPLHLVTKGAPGPELRRMIEMAAQMSGL